MSSKSKQYVTVTIWPERDGVEYEIEIEASYLPGTEDVPYLSNGDPGHPGDPEEIEFLAAYTVPDGEDWELSPSDEDKAREAVIEAIE
jgi:hypothetical protein